MSSTPPPVPRSAPRLLADIGATYARFCVEQVSGRFEHVSVLPCASFSGFVEVVQAYINTLPSALRPRHAAVAIANPIEGDRVRMINRDWAFSIRDAQARLGLSALLLVNNFTALAMALPHIGASGRMQVGGGMPQEHGVIGLIGPGTGLGVSGLVPSGADRWSTLASEGGHAGFSPSDEREMKILAFAWQHHPHVSAERLVSGPGLELTYRALAAEAGASTPALEAAEIVRRAMGESDALCMAAAECFCRMLGTVAANVALMLGATGGIYIGGGIVPRLGNLFLRSGFRERFEHKGRLSDYVARIPTYVVTAEHPAFLGVSSLLSDHLPGADAGNPLLDRVRAARPTLSPAEGRVADFVLAHPRAMLNDPVGVIAQMAEVSQPTVIRFCRTLGMQGLADFKLKLASGLNGNIPVQRAQVRRHDATPDLCAKVLDNTISAIMQFRESLNVEAVDRAIGLLRSARRVEIYAIGNSTAVAADVQHKLFRFRIPSSTHTDLSTQALAAELLGPQDVTVFISSSGQPPELVRAATVALERGAAVIAITASHSPLSRRATVCVPVDHGEDASSFMSMISRILHLLVVDMMAVGIAVRREPDGGLPQAGTTPAGKAAAGVLISHVV